jgi:predicted DNA-binding protein
MKRFNFFLPEQIIAALKLLSEKTGISVSEHLRRAIESYLRKQKS